MSEERGNSCASLICQTCSPRIQRFNIALRPFNNRPGIVNISLVQEMRQTGPETVLLQCIFDSRTGRIKKLWISHVVVSIFGLNVLLLKVLIDFDSSVEVVLGLCMLRLGW
jgi:hypothetical protein